MFILSPERKYIYHFIACFMPRMTLTFEQPEGVLMVFRCDSDLVLNGFRAASDMIPIGSRWVPLASEQKRRTSEGGVPFRGE